jgi:16S rRNA (uracil1498-N3)-methyltransferase
LEHLSKIELYYTPPDFIVENEITISGDEFKHAVKVMRNSVGDNLYVSNGNGTIYLSKISSIKKEVLNAHITKSYEYKNVAKDLVFCIPKLKNPERLKFALEKCVELGITRFKIFESKHTISKTNNLKRLEKIALSAMKQSLRSFLPQIEFETLNQILVTEGDKIVFDQKGKNDFMTGKEITESAYFIFGPEGGFDQSEIVLFSKEKVFKLSNNRLRTETAIVKCASLLNLP